MSVVLEYRGYYEPDSTVPAEVLDEWESTLKAERARILSALLEKIPSESEFISKLAEPAYQGWANFINPTYPDADMRKLKFRVKIKGAYEDWQTGVQNAFAEGGTFDTNVTNKKAKMNKLRYVTGAVGIRYKTGWGVAYKALGLITGDSRVKLYFGANDNLITGDVMSIFPAGIVKWVRALGIGILTQGLVIAQYAHEAGLATDRDAVISAVNAKIDDSVEKLVSEGYSLELAIEFDGVANKLAVHETVTSTA
ncbi:MAG: hypothetical protein ACXQTI_03615 [Candidatus Nezhaarchaeales archaeon]